jgi:hypothetical protein
MDAGRLNLDALQFPSDILPVSRKSPKPDNLLITKRKILDFCLPKAENILKIRQLDKIQTQNTK